MTLEPGARIDEFATLELRRRLALDLQYRTPQPLRDAAAIMVNGVTLCPVQRALDWIIGNDAVIAAINRAADCAPGMPDPAEILVWAIQPVVLRRSRDAAAIWKYWRFPSLKIFMTWISEAPRL